MTKKELLKQIKNEVLNLKSSPLYKERIENNNFPVIGEGNHDASVMFIGEAPGAREAKTGRPFCGTAGRVLDDCLKEINIERKTVYITNVIKDRPPKNRDPLPAEIEIYSSFLDRQIEIIKPQVLVTLGRFSTEYILKRHKLTNKIKPITALHGNPIDFEMNYGIIKILPLLHPAVAIYNHSKKDVLMKGFLVLKKLIEDKKEVSEVES
jgi:uracil-DNA glycosylase